MLSCPVDRYIADPALPQSVTLLAHRLSKLIVGMHEVMGCLCLMALETGTELHVRIRRFLRREDPVFPTAVAHGIRVLASPAGALLHDAIAHDLALEVMAVRSAAWIALCVEQSGVSYDREHGAVGHGGTVSCGLDRGRHHIMLVEFLPIGAVDDEPFGSLGIVLGEGHALGSGMNARN